MTTQFILVWIGLTLGNVLYQSVTAHDWSRVYERSFYQGIAILACWIVIRRLKT